MTLKRHQQIDFFHGQRQSRDRLETVPQGLAPADKDEAYAILSGVHQRMRSNGAVQQGFKIGCTTDATQKAQNTNEPTWAGLFAADRYDTIDEALRVLAPPVSIECEIVFRLGADLDHRAVGLAPEELARAAVDECMIGCEIVKNRYGRPLERGLPTLIADDFFQAGYVLGQPAATWRELDLSALQAECRIDGKVMEKGVSSLVIGGPLNALSWLAADLAARGRALRAGDIVFSGSITPPLQLDSRPKSAELWIEGLGELR